MPGSYTQATQPNVIVSGPLTLAADAGDQMITLLLLPSNAQKLTVTGFTVVNDADITASDTNNWVFTLEGVTSGGSATSIGVVSTAVTGGATLAADVPTAATITETSNANRVAAGSRLRVKCTQTDTAPALANTVFTVFFTWGTVNINN